MPPEVPQFFSPEAVGGPAPLTPVVYAAASVRFVDPKLKVDESRLVTWTAPIGDGAVALDWDNASAVDWAPELLERDPPDDARYAAVPAPALKARSYDAWAKQFVTAVLTKESLEVMRSPSTGETSRADESERDFRARLQQASRESRDRALDALRRKYAPRQAALEEKLRRAKQAVERGSQQATGQKLQTMISVGATLMGALMGRKVTLPARSVERRQRHADEPDHERSDDIDRAKQTVTAIDEQRQALEDELRTETATLESIGNPATETFERVSIKPKRTNIAVKLVCLVWSR